MPNIIRHKRSSTSGVVPVATGLSQGELAINIADGRLYTKNNNNNIINLGVTSISGTSITPSSGLFSNGIGINTNTPSGFLDVAGDVYVRGTGNNLGTIYFKSQVVGDKTLYVGATNGGDLIMNGGSSIQLSTQGGSLNALGSSTQIHIGHGYDGANTTQIIRFLPAAKEMMRMTTSGTMGIGLPTSASSYAGNSVQLFSTQPYSNTRVHIAGSGANSSSAALIVTNSGISPLFYVRNDGNIGIGTTTPTSTLHVAGDVLATGSFIGGSGTALLPSFEFINDPDTGLFSPAANTFGISTSGVERLRVDSVGNIGIGTVTPSGKLHVSGTIIASGGNSTNWNTAYGWGNHAGAGYITNYISNGITIAGNDGSNQNIVFENDGAPVADITWDDLNDRLQINALQVNITAENGLIVETDSPIQFNPNGGGNVGIGIVNPTSKLHVAGDILATGSFIGGSGTASLPSFEFINDPDTGLFSPSANTLAISTSGVERLRIANNGSISMSGSLNVDPNTSGQINCMYVNAGPSLGGSLTTDTLYLNYAINTINYATAIALSDSVTISSDPGANITLYDSASISSNAGANITLTDNIGISCGGDIGLNGYSIALTCDPSATIELNGPVNVNGDLTFDSYTESVVVNGNSGASKTLSLASGTVHTCTLTNNCTFTMPTATAGKSFSMFLNSGSGNYTASFSGVRWADSAIPTATITASKVDIYSFISDGSFWYGSFSQNYG
jgi:hypothetical protein